MHCQGYPHAHRRKFQVFLLRTSGAAAMAWHNHVLPLSQLSGGPAAQLVREGLRGPFVATSDRAAADIVFTPRPVQDFYSLPRCGAARASAGCRALDSKPCMRLLPVHAVGSLSCLG